MVRSIRRLVLLPASIAIGLAASAPAQNAPRGPDRNQPGPWNNAIVVYRLATDGSSTMLANFERAGVPTVARLSYGRLMAAHQHFPENNDTDFDKVAVHFSS